MFIENVLRKRQLYHVFFLSFFKSLFLPLSLYFDLCCLPLHDVSLVLVCKSLWTNVSAIMTKSECGLIISYIHVLN